MNEKSWGQLMEVARATARQRDERVRVSGGLLRDRKGVSTWRYVVECASWCPCRKRPADSNLQPPP